jgi:hypothetical protein
MATTTIDIEVKGLGSFDKAIDAIDAGKGSVNSLKMELRNLQNELATLDPASDKFVEMSQRAGEVRDSINNATESINANAGPAFERLGNNASLLTQKLGALDFGGASESVKLLAANVKGVNFKDLSGELGGFVKSLGTLGKALLTNPIFLLATAILAIVMNFETLKNVIPGVNAALTGVTEEMTDALEASKQMTEESKKQLALISEQENILKLQGKSEREILNMKVKAAEQTLIDLKAQMTAQANIAKAQVETAKRNKEIASGIIQFLTIPIQSLLGAVDYVAGVLGKETGLRDSFNDMASSLLFDPDEVAKKNEEVEKQLQDDYKNLENQRAGFLLSLQNLDKQDADKAKAITDAQLKQRLEAEKKLLEAKQRAEDAITEMERKAREQRMQAEKEAEDLRLKTLADQAELRDELFLSEQEKEIAAIDQKYIKMRELAHGNAELLKALAEKNQAEVDAINEKYAQSEKDRQAAAAQAKVQLAGTAISALMQLNDAFEAGSERAARRQFAINKALALAQAIQNTYLAATAVLKDPTYVGPARWVAVGAAITTGLANVVKIARSKFEASGGGGSGSSGGGGGAPSVSGGAQANAPTFTPLSTTSFLGQQTTEQQPVQAYVLASNVESSMQAKEKIKDQSTL